jgi:ribosomal protein L37E
MAEIKRILRWAVYNMRDERISEWCESRAKAESKLLAIEVGGGIGYVDFAPKNPINAPLRGKKESYTLACQHCGKIVVLKQYRDTATCNECAYARKLARARQQWESKKASKERVEQQ